MNTSATASASRVEDIQGRTIHPDGTIIPFTGKPYDKLVEKTQGIKFMAKVFTMPDVEVGSIIEYRYKLRYDDNYLQAPSGTFSPISSPARPTISGGPSTYATMITSTTIAVSSPTPSPGPRFCPPAPSSSKPASRPAANRVLTFELNMHDIPPAPEEDFMPPIPASPIASSSTTPPIAPARSSGRTKANTGPRIRTSSSDPGPPSLQRSRTSSLRPTRRTRSSANSTRPS